MPRRPSKLPDGSWNLQDLDLSKLSDNLIDCLLEVSVFKNEPHFCSLCEPFKPPHYSTDYDASSRLVAAMSNLGWGIQHGAPQMDRSHVYFRKKPLQVYATDASLCRATALAALLAVQKDQALSQ